MWFVLLVPVQVKVSSKTINHQIQAELTTWLDVLMAPSSAGQSSSFLLEADSVVESRSLFSG